MATPRKGKAKVAMSHHVTADEAREWFKKNYDLTILED